MYEAHWNLNCRPFENLLGDSHYYPAETHQAALLKVRYAIENRRAAALLCGPGGMGKTLLVEMLRRSLSEQFTPFASVVFPAMANDQFVRYVVDQVDGFQPENAREPATDLARFEQFLRANMEANRHAVIVVDEAQVLEQNNLLEPLRLLLNIAADTAKGEAAFTLLMVGQPTLLSHVERYHALDERLAVKCMLNRLLPEETNAYIQHRIRNSGAEADEIFEASAIERIHALTQGIPRRINRLCDLALMVGYAEDFNRISSDVVDNVHGDLAAPVIG